MRTEIPRLTRHPERRRLPPSQMALALLMCPLPVCNTNTSPGCSGRNASMPPAAPVLLDVRTADPADDLAGGAHDGLHHDGRVAAQTGLVAPPARRWWVRQPLWTRSRSGAMKALPCTGRCWSGSSCGARVATCRSTCIRFSRTRHGADQRRPGRVSQPRQCHGRDPLSGIRRAGCRHAPARCACARPRRPRSRGGTRGGSRRVRRCTGQGACSGQHGAPPAAARASALTPRIRWAERPPEGP